MAAKNSDTDAPLKLLSLDGGGIRGIASLIILKHLMKQLKPTGPPLKPCEFFDLIGGTSTGGIIAIMLGRLRMDVQTCIEKYIELSSAAFTPKRVKANFLAKWKDKWEVDGKYCADILTEKICEVVQRYDAEGDGQANLLEQNSACKVLVCATSTARTRSVRLRSYTAADIVDSLSASNCKIWEAARATSAAPTFFDKIKIGEQVFVDGATGANNPVESVLEEAKSIWPNAIQKGRIQCMVSIGTGVPDLEKFGSNLKEVVETLKNIATETETTETRFYKNHGFLGIDGRYFRFNVDRGLYDVQLDDNGKIAEIEASAEAYLEAPRVKKLMEEFLAARAPVNELLDVGAKDRHMSWLATVDNLKQHSEAQKSRTPGLDTGRWLLDHPLENWKRIPKSFMWLNGKAGSGKSVLVSSIIDKLQKEPDSVVIYFYLSFRDQATQDLTALKKSLLMQLVRHLVREVRKGYFYVPSVFQLLFDRYYYSQSPPEDRVDATIAGLLDELPQIFIVVDALDEFPEQAEVSKGDRASIVKFLEGVCQRSHGGVHALVSSRRLPDIEAAVDEVNLPKATVLMGAEQVNADIKAFLMDSLRKPPFNKAPWSNPLRKNVTKTLTTKANGVFRWAALQLLALRGKDRGRDIEISLGELPEGLSETYKVMLTRIENAGRSKMAMSVLQWLAHSQRSLTLREVSEIAVMETGQEHCGFSTNSRDFDVSFQPKNRFVALWMARKVLSGLITVSGIDDQDETTGGKDGTVSFSHFTVQEYLQGENVSPVKFRLSRTASHWYIMRCCLGYLSFYDTFYDTQYGDDVDKPQKECTNTAAVSIEDSDSEFDFPDSEPEDAEEFDCRPFPLLRYAAKYWWRHAALACSDTAEPFLLDAVARIASDKDRLQGKAFQCIVKAALATDRYDRFEKQRAREARKLVSTPSQKGSDPPDMDKDEDQLHTSAAAVLACLEKSCLTQPAAPDPQAQAFDWESAVALLLSAELGDEVAVQLLLDGGADVNYIQYTGQYYTRSMDSQERQGDTALHKAVKNNHKRVVEQLAGGGANMNPLDQRARTPLSWAAGLGHKDIAAYLIDKGAMLDIDDTDPNHISSIAPNVFASIQPFCILFNEYPWSASKPGKGQTCLHWAVIKRHQEVAILLVEKGANFLEADHWGPCPLSIAVVSGQTDPVRAMIKKDKDRFKEAKFYGGWTAVHLAAAHRDLAMLRLLVPEAADISRRDNNYLTALDMAAIGTEALVQQRVPRSARYADYIVGEKNPRDTIQFLIQNGCSVERGGEHLSSPLHYAALFNQPESAEALLENDANADAVNKYGWTPLLHAASAGAIAVVKMLLSHSVDVNKTTKEGLTALIVASANGFVEVVRDLLDAGANGDLREQNGKTAFMLASELKRAEVVHLFESSACDSSLEQDNSNGDQTLETAVEGDADN